MARSSLLVTGALLSIVALGSLPSAAEEGQAEDPSAISFEGKIVMVIVDRSNALEKRETSEIFKEAAIRKVGGRYFITGIAYPRPDEQNDWRGGAEAGVAWDHVHQYYAYTPEQFKKLEESWAQHTGE